MKIRNKDRKIDIQMIIIEKYDNRTYATIIINNQSINLIIPAVYSDSVFEYIENYFQVLGDDTYVRL